MTADSCVAPAELHDAPLPAEITGRARRPFQAASRVTLAVTHIGETECMHRPFPVARRLRQSRAPATEPSPLRTLRQGNDALQERRDAWRTSELRMIRHHQSRSPSPARAHEQVGIARVDVAGARGALQNEADG